MLAETDISFGYESEEVCCVIFTCHYILCSQSTFYIIRTTTFVFPHIKIPKSFRKGEKNLTLQASFLRPLFGLYIMLMHENSSLNSS